MGIRDLVTWQTGIDSAERPKCKTTTETRARDEKCISMRETEPVAFLRAIPFDENLSFNGWKRASDGQNVNNIKKIEEMDDYDDGLKDLFGKHVQCLFYSE